MSYDFDLVCIGSGPAGQRAAVQTAKLGKRAAIIEKRRNVGGICLDTGNPFSVGEDPVAFTSRAAHRIRHVHLKDYVAQFTDQGYRLVRCAIGDGAVPFKEIAVVLQAQGTPLAASIEPGALESRHIRLFTPGWWEGYPARDARELGTMLGRLRARRLADDADCQTPWERGESGAALQDYELGQVRRSVKNVRELGICDA